ncbi:MAG: DEAD/DEAH box helicase [Spirochaetes bacterium]|nr:DEAD/DEAH box helicase [Spirochaetota bacterium]
MDNALELFHPLVARWFRETLGEPTGIQTQAWTEIAAGSHVLATAPTGSGKTLAAFLWALNQLAAGAWQGGAPRVLYISPHKALNNDIRKNLTIPLEGLREHFGKNGAVLPPIGVMTRSGDTPPEERRLLYRHPPEILITTPESLNIMVTSGSGRALFRGITTVILDEIHALAGTKRGTHLMTAVERLTLISGEFQRIALSATVRPLETVADFIGGFRLVSGATGPRYEKRPVTILRAEDTKSYALSIEYPERPGDDGEDDTWWQVLSRRMKETIRGNRSTLFFANSRRVAEKMARYLNEDEGEIIAYSHHGSIAREIRLEVEERMKRGELKAIVATSSLELGIDIGDLDEVILVQTPFSISSCLQRLGRAGHGVGERSAGRIFPTHGMDLLTAAVMARCVDERGIEPVRPVECPLDILAQVIVSMTAAETWNIDDLYNFLKTCHPYHNLSRNQYGLVLEMLAGRYADSRLKELSQRVSIDRLDNTVAARAGAAYIIYTSGGTIPDRGYYDMRVQGAGSKIGELDEEFVWERKIGDTFTLGTQGWRIQNITHNDVEVVPLRGTAGMLPFWKAEERDRDFYYSEKILSFLKEADEGLGDPEGFIDRLRHVYSMDENAAASLADFLQRQKAASGGKLPHRGRVVIEHYHDGSGASDSTETVLHTFWGGRVNRPYAMALAAAWEERYHTPLEIFVSDANILLILTGDVSIREALSLVTAENLEELLRKRMESSGFFGARFRINAARALLLPRATFKKRYPLWLNRLRSRKLLETVMAYPDFPILLETWRECLQDDFDLESLKILLDEAAAGRIEFTETTNSAPSPFCGSLIWRQTNKYMYQDDAPEGRGQSNLSQAILDEVLHSSRLRPRIPARLAADLESRLQRLRAGYAPSSPAELLDWLKERLLIPLDEWDRLAAACRRDSPDFPAELPPAISEKISTIILPGSTVTHRAALENVPLIRSLFGMADDGGAISPGAGTSAVESEMDRADFLAQWLSYYGPLRRERITESLGIRGGDLEDLLERLAEERRIIVDAIIEGSDSEEVCYTDNLERLLRMARQDRQPSFKALGPEYLQLFLASHQGAARPGETMEDMQKRMEKLFGYPAPAHLWEEAILPARMRDYRTEWLDSLLHTTPLKWVGAGKKTVTFVLEDEARLFIEPGRKEIERALRIFPDRRGRYNLFDIAGHMSANTGEAARVLWELAWKGTVVNDSMEALRKGIQNDFVPAGLENVQPLRVPGRRAGMSRWAATRPVQESWRMLDTEQAELDGIDRQETDRDRARSLFDRYGVLFRELLESEAPAMRWKKMFPVLRLMELSGEIMSGYFFEGIPGAQFISPEAFRILREGLDEDLLYWLNARDPASLCGIAIEGLKGTMPRRAVFNHIVCIGKRIVMELQKSGKDLRIHIPPDHPRLQEALGIYKAILTRGFNPVNPLNVEKINGLPAIDSEYCGVLKEFGFRPSYKALTLWKTY